MQNKTTLLPNPSANASGAAKFMMLAQQHLSDSFKGLNDIFNKYSKNNQTQHENKFLAAIQRAASKDDINELRNGNIPNKTNSDVTTANWLKQLNKRGSEIQQSQLNQNVLSDKFAYYKDRPLVNKYTQSINGSKSPESLRLTTEAIGMSAELSEKGKADLFALVSKRNNTFYERKQDQDKADALSSHQQAQRDNALEVNKLNNVAASERANNKKSAATTKAEHALKSLATNTYSNAQDTKNAIGNISDLDIENAGGGSSIGGAWLPESRGSVAKLNQVLSQQFLNNISQMKGLGSMSNAEGSKVTGAATALVDPETNALKTGLPEDFIKEQLGILKAGASNMQAISKFHQEHGREPNIEEWKALTASQPEPENTESQVINWSDL